MIAFVGKSGSGKTTLLEKIISYIIKEGHAVAVIKHTHHQPEPGNPFKDDAKFSKAGAWSAIVNEKSPEILNIYASLEAALLHAPKNAIIILEGFKKLDCSKVEVWRKNVSDKPIFAPTQLLGLITDTPLEGYNNFSFEDIHQIVKLILEEHHVSANLSCR